MSRYILLAAVLMFAPALFLQGQGQGKGKGKNEAARLRAVRSARSHDLNGVWRRSGGVLTMSNETPMTAWAKARFDAAKPVYGPRGFPAAGVIP
jgi:hypothetical protein